MIIIPYIYVPDFSVSKPCQKYAHGLTFSRWAYIWCKHFISDFSLNSKLKSILMRVSVEDSDIEVIGSDESDEALEIVDGDDIEYDSHDDEIGMMINNDDEN